MSGLNCLNLRFITGLVIAFVACLFLYFMIQAQIISRRYYKEMAAYGSAVMSLQELAIRIPRLEDHGSNPAPINPQEFAEWLTKRLDREGDHSITVRTSSSGVLDPFNQPIELVADHGQLIALRISISCGENGLGVQEVVQFLPREGLSTSKQSQLQVPPGRP